MTLYLLRHADAEPFAGSDAARRLTERGREQAEQVGRFCHRQKLHPELILTSPLVRTEQTARIVGERLGVEVVIAPFIASGMRPFDALEELKAYQRFGSVMLVGHQPDLGELIAVLTGLATPLALPVRKASLTALDIHALQPEGASLDFTLPVGLM